MKYIHGILIACCCLTLVGCGTQNLPEVQPVVDIVEDVQDTGEEVIEAGEEVVDEALDVIEQIKQRNEDSDTEDENEANEDELVDGDDLPEDSEEVEPKPSEEEAAAAGITYVMDVEESTVNWKGEKVVPGKGHYGTVAIKEGSAVYINSALTSASAVLDMTTIKSELGENLDGHLKNEDFFDVANHPEAIIEITSTEIVPDEVEGDYTMATANLTIKGITNEITFPVYNDEYWDVANITIDRTLWDIKYGSASFFDDLADKAIKDEITFEVNIAYE